MSLLVLTARDVQKAAANFEPNELVGFMRTVFVMLSSPRSTTPVAFTPQRVVISTSHHTALFMPARLVDPGLGGTTIKTVCVPKTASDDRGLPATTLLLNEETGAVRAIVNARSLTALRNAAGSLLSTQLVGPSTPESIVAFGAGKQIEAHLDIHIRSFASIKRCTIVNRNANARVDNLLCLLRSRFPEVQFQVIINDAGNVCLQTSEQLRKVMSTANIVICATSSTIPLFPSSWIRTKTHVILIGSYTPEMQEVSEELIKRAFPRFNPPGQHGGMSAGFDEQTEAILLVDSREACAKEAGELIRAGVQEGDVIEIGAYILAGGHEKDSKSEMKALSGLAGDDGPITLFKSVGVGLQDVAIARAVVDKAEALGIGVAIEDYD